VIIDHLKTAKWHHDQLRIHAEEAADGQCHEGGRVAGHKATPNNKRVGRPIPFRPGLLNALY
jgi:hypothetical protein